jgi:hypothetical protein
MTLPLPLPDWLPWWVPLAVLVPVLLYLMVFLLMPFSVLGLKGRLENLESRLDEIQGEIRALGLRLPEARGEEIDWPQPAPPAPPQPERASGERPLRPPIPPPPFQVPRRTALDAPQPSSAETETPTQRVAAERDLEGPGTAPATSTPYRRPLLRPTRPQRSEPRLDWPR